MTFHHFEHLDIVQQLYEVFLAVSRAVQRNLMFCNESTRFDQRLNIYVMSVVVYDVGYNTVE